MSENEENREKLNTYEFSVAFSICEWFERPSLFRAQGKIYL